MLLSSAEIFETSLTNSVDPDQTALVPMLANKQTFSS